MKLKKAQELGTSVFPLYAYSGPTDGTYTVDGVQYDVGTDFRTRESYAQYAAAGLNILLLQGNDPYTGEPWETCQTKKNMDNASAADLWVIVFDKRLHDLCLKKPLVGEGAPFATQQDLIFHVKNCVKDYSAHSAFYGIQLKDEPRDEYLESVGALYRAVKAVLPEAFVQVNLFPMNASANKDSYFGTTPEKTLESNYRQYLEHFLSATGADYILYDNYPFLNENGLQYVRPDHIPGLVLASKVARAHGVKFYQVAQSCSMDVNGVSKIRTPSQADMQWQVNLLLSFGVKQISYFTYWTKQTNCTTGELFPDGTAFVSRDGTVNALHHWMRDIHGKLQNIAAHILPLRLDGCMSDVKDEISAYGQIENDTLSAVEGYRVEKGKGAFVTQLSDEKTVAICIQNICDPEVYADDVLSLTLTVNLHGTPGKIASIGSGRASISGRTITAELRPGEAVFWFIKK